MYFKKRKSIIEKQNISMTNMVNVKYFIDSLCVINMVINKAEFTNIFVNKIPRNERVSGMLTAHRTDCSLFWDLEHSLE